MALRYEVEGSSYWDLVYLAQLSRWEKADELGVAWGRGEHGRGVFWGRALAGQQVGRAPFFFRRCVRGAGGGGQRLSPADN